MVAVVADPQILVCPEPAMRFQDPEGGIGEAVWGPVHQHLAARRTDRGETTDQVEIAEQSGQGDRWHDPALGVGK